MNTATLENEPELKRRTARRGWGRSEGLQCGGDQSLCLASSCQWPGSSDILLFAGIQVRHDQDLGYMHHKFAIVDRKVLITGSLNWTTQAIQNNRENVLIMEDEEYVRLFLEEFERIWEEFNPTRFTFFPQKERAR